MLTLFGASFAQTGCERLFVFGASNFEYSKDGKTNLKCIRRSVVNWFLITNGICSNEHCENAGCMNVRSIFFYCKNTENIFENIDFTPKLLSIRFVASFSMWDVELCVSVHFS